MPDDILTDSSISFTSEEIEFIYNVLNSVQVTGMEAIHLMAKIGAKLSVYYTPPVPTDESED